MRRGVEIVLLRPLGPNTELGQWLPDALRKDGFDVTELPLLEIVASEELAELGVELRNLDRSDWVVFTSANAVRIAFDAHATLFTERFRYAVVGKKTANTLSAFGRAPTLVSSRGTAAALGDELRAMVRHEKSRVLFIRGRIASPEIFAAVQSAGGECRECVAYETRRRHLNEAEKQQLLRFIMRDTPSSLIPVFTNGESVREFWSLLHGLADEETLLAGLKRFSYAVIGTETEKALLEIGLTASVVAKEASLEGVRAALLEFCTTK